LPAAEASSRIRVTVRTDLPCARGSRAFRRQTRFNPSTLPAARSPTAGSPPPARARRQYICTLCGAVGR
jgi:hypothetical protein